MNFKKIFVLIFAVAAIIFFAFNSQILAFTGSTRCPWSFSPAGSCRININSIYIGTEIIDSAPSSEIQKTEPLPGCIKSGSELPLIWQYNGNDVIDHWYVRYACASDGKNLNVEQGVVGKPKLNFIRWTAPQYSEANKYCKIWIQAKKQGNASEEDNETLGGANSRPFAICAPTATASQNFKAMQDKAISPLPSCNPGETKIQTLPADNVNKVVDGYSGRTKLACVANAKIECANQPDGVQVNFYFTRGGYDATGRTFGGSGGISASSRNVSMDFLFDSPDSQYCYRAVVQPWNKGVLGNPIYGEEQCCIENVCNNNGVCESWLGEKFENCPGDCHCGNSNCETALGETYLTCPSDCQYSPPKPSCNNNSICESWNNENEANCADCKTTVPSDAGYACFSATQICVKNYKSYPLGYLDTQCGSDLLKYFPGQTTGVCYQNETDCKAACTPGQKFFTCHKDNVCRITTQNYQTARECTVDIIGKYSDLKTPTCYTDENSCIDACSDTKKWYYCPTRGMDCKETDITFYTKNECESFLQKRPYLSNVPVCYNLIENCRKDCLIPQQYNGYYCNSSGKCVRTENVYLIQDIPGLGSKCASDVASYVNKAFPGCYSSLSECEANCKPGTTGNDYYVCLKDIKTCQKLPDKQPDTQSCAQYVNNTFPGITDGVCYDSASICGEKCAVQECVQENQLSTDLTKQCCEGLKAVAALQPDSLSADGCKFIIGWRANTVISKYLAGALRATNSGFYCTKCGDGQCTGKENYCNCMDDCHCGDKKCQSDYGENYTNCASDCTKPCKNEGELIETKNEICCSGLVSISDDTPNSLTGECDKNTDGYGYCAKLGDGQCTGKENYCNSADCAKPDNKKTFNICVTDQKKCQVTAKKYTSTQECQSDLQADASLSGRTNGICYSDSASCDNICSTAKQYQICLGITNKCMATPDWFVSLADCNKQMDEIYKGLIIGQCHENLTSCEAACNSGEKKYVYCNKNQGCLDTDRTFKTAQECATYVSANYGANATGICYDTKGQCQAQCQQSNIKESKNILIINKKGALTKMPHLWPGELPLALSEFSKYYFYTYNFTSDPYKEFSKYDTIVLLLGCPEEYLPPADILALQKWVQEGGKLIRYNAGDTATECTEEMNAFKFYKAPVLSPAKYFAIEEDNTLSHSNSANSSYIDVNKMLYRYDTEYGLNAKIWPMESGWCSDISVNKTDTGVREPVHAYRYYGKGMIIYNGFHFGNDFSLPSVINTNDRNSNLSKIWLQELQQKWGETESQLACIKPIAAKNSIPGVWYASPAMHFRGTGKSAPEVVAWQKQMSGSRFAILKGEIKSLGGDSEGVDVFFEVAQKGLPNSGKSFCYQFGLKRLGAIYCTVYLNSNTEYTYTFRAYNRYGINQNPNMIEFKTEP